MNTIADKLVNYGLLNLGLNILDANYIRNDIFHILNIYSSDPFEEDVDSCLYETPHSMTEELRKFIIENEIAEEGYQTNLLIDKIMGLMMPLPSVFYEQFYDIYTYAGDEEALRFLTKIEVNSNYINLFNINKNIKWEERIEDNLIEYTINLSKPEKSNKDIAAALANKNNTNTTPKCVLCYENEGFYGSASKEPRSTLRVVPVTLNGTNWFMQLSPYVYFENHIILFNKDHVPMKIAPETLEYFISFVDQYPHYFIGSNADLPIVGGSILSHEHYQGGTHIMPVMKSSSKMDFRSKIVKNCSVKYLKRFNSTLLLESESADELKKTYNIILDAWRKYNDIELGIEAEKDGAKHNTITPILRKVEKKYMLYLILRCNCTSKEFEEGIFHVHPQYFNIKHEGIGLIEAMGLYILPARLKTEIETIKAALISNDIKKFISEHEELVKHEKMIEDIARLNPTNENVNKLVIDYISNVGKEILKNTAVFKENQDEHLINFMNSIGFTKEK